MALDYPSLGFAFRLGWVEEPEYLINDKISLIWYQKKLLASLSMNMAILWNGLVTCLLMVIPSFFGIAKVNAYVAFADHHMDMR